MKNRKKAAILLSLVLSGFYGTVNAAGSEDQPIYESGQDPYAYNWFKEDTYGKTYEKTGGSLKAIAEGNGKVRAYTAFVEGIQIKLKDVAVSASARGTNGGDTVQAMAVYGAKGSDIEINGGNLEATAEGGGQATAYAVRADSGSDNPIILKDVALKADAEGSESAGAYALYTSGRSVALDNVTITASADSENTKAINSFAVYGDNGSDIDISGGMIQAEAHQGRKTAYAIYANSSTISVNSDEDVMKTTVIYGDLQSGGKDENNKGKISINLNTPDSELKGTAWAADNGEIHLSLSNQAVWETDGHFNSTITSLTMDHGIIRPTYPGSKAITIENYFGVGDILLDIGDDRQTGDIDVDAGGTNITAAAKGSVLNMTVQNDNFIDTITPEKAMQNLNKIASEIYYKANDGNLTGKVTIREGLIAPEAQGDLLFDDTDRHQGYVANVISKRTTTTMDAMKGFSAVPLLSWRQEDATLSQRLGDLRRSAGGQGIWARMSRGEFQYDGEYKNQYDFYQLGYDWASGPWHYGAAVSYNDGETSYRAGYGENSSTSLSLYGTWLGDKGHYADIVLKGGKLSNEYTITTDAGRTHGDYDMWGVSLSGEYGREIALADGWFVTPQAQMTLLHIGSEDYTTSNGIRVSQESLDSAVGRLGLEAGKQFGAGRVYGKFSLLHDFAGSADTYLSLNGLTNEYEQDIGDTWWEAGFGADIRLSESTWLYADVVRTFGGDIDTPWQWNAGVRWGF